MPLKTMETLEIFWTAQDGKSRARKCGLLLLAATILAFLLPYDSNGEIDFVFGAGEWLAHSLILMVSTGVTGRWLFPRFNKPNTSVALVVMLYAVINAVPVFMMSVIFDFLLTSYEAPFSYGSAIYLGWIIESTFLTLLVIGALSVVAIKFEFASPDMASTPGPRPGQIFLNRLSPDVGTELLCLEMEDHYLRVHTEQGNQLLHMRMADAILELEDFPGFQVHRSWWVTTGAIETIDKQGRDYKAHLKNGMTVPISRSRVSTLKEHGFL